MLFCKGLGVAAQVTTQLALILKSGNLGTEQEAIDKFVEAFMSILSDPTMVQNEKSIVRPYSLLPMACTSPAQRSHVLHLPPQTVADPCCENH